MLHGFDYGSASRITNRVEDPFHHLGIAVIEEAGPPGLECGNRRHVLGAELEVEDLEVLHVRPSSPTWGSPSHRVA